MSPRRLGLDLDARCAPACLAAVWRALEAGEIAPGACAGTVGSARGPEHAPLRVFEDGSIALGAHRFDVDAPSDVWLTDGERAGMHRPAIFAAEAGEIVDPQRLDPTATARSNWACASAPAQVLARSLGLLAPRLDLRWVMLELELPRPRAASPFGPEEPVSAGSLLRVLERATPGLAGKLSLRCRVGEADYAMGRLFLNVGGAPGRDAIVQSLEDALAAPQWSRHFEILAESGRAAGDQLRGRSRASLLLDSVEALGSLARVDIAFDPDALLAGRLVELATLVPLEGEATVDAETASGLEVVG